ncbi:MAG: hypothetical protein RLY87_2225 [Chloroflexota bacterium]|jgi:iron(III) transport system substrate-binding protein
MLHRLRLGIVCAAYMFVVSCAGVPQSNQPAPRENMSESKFTDSAATTLVIYSGRSEALIKPVIDAFVAANPSITVQLKAGKDNELAAAILEEQARPQADVYITTNMLTTIALGNQGVLAAHTVPAAEQIPSRYRSADALWTPITLRARVIMYNKELVAAADAPKTMAALGDAKWQGKIAAANSTNGSMQAHIATLIAQSGPDAATAFLNALIANETTFFGGHTDVRKAVGAGEFAIGIVNHYYYEMQKREPSDNNVAVIYPDQGTDENGLIVNATAAAIIKNAQHPDAAKRFVDFLFQSETQQLFAELNYEYPILPNIPLAKDMTPLTELRIAEVPLTDIAAQVTVASAQMAAAGIP